MRSSISSVATKSSGPAGAHAKNIGGRASKSEQSTGHGCMAKDAPTCVPKLLCYTRLLAACVYVCECEGQVRDATKWPLNMKASKACEASTPPACWSAACEAVQSWCMCMLSMLLCVPSFGIGQRFLPDPSATGRSEQADASCKNAEHGD